MDSEQSEYKIHIRISAANGEQIIKDDQVDVCTDRKSNGSVQTSLNKTSYLSNLSSALKSLRHDTNSVLTQYITTSSQNIAETADGKEMDPEEDEEDSSDDDKLG